MNDICLTQSLGRLCLNAIDETFHSGSFLATLSVSTERTDSRVRILVSHHRAVPVAKLVFMSHIQPESSLSQIVNTISTTPTFASIAFLAKLTSRATLEMSEAKSRSVRIQAWDLLAHLTETLQLLAVKIEESWLSSPLAAVASDSEIGDFLITSLKKRPF